ncbi:hypothetical protein SLA2020_507700 [Shorea laevis]
MQETRVSEDHHALFPNNYDLAYAYEEIPPILDLNFTNPPSEFNDLWEEKAAFEEEQLLPGGWRNWRWEYDSIFSGLSGNGVVPNGDNGVVPNGDARNENGHDGNAVKSEDSYHVDENYEGFSSCCDDAYYQGDADYNPWSGNAYREEEDSITYGEEAYKSWYRYGMDEVGFCDSIFGYFPCLLKDQRPYD